MLLFETAGLTLLEATSSLKTNTVGLLQEEITLPFVLQHRSSHFLYPTEAKRLAQKYETLISVRAPVGKQNMALEECCNGRGIAAFNYKTNSEYYTYTYFKMRSLMDEIKQFNNEGTVFGSISKTDFQALSISIPPQNLVDKFQDEAKPIDDKLIENTIQIRTLEKNARYIITKVNEWRNSS